MVAPTLTAGTAIEFVGAGIARPTIPEGIGPYKVQRKIDENRRTGSSTPTPHFEVLFEFPHRKG